MLAKTHVLSATPLLIPAAAYIHNPTFLLVFGAGLFLGAVAPDIDETNSFISRRFRVLYALVYLVRIVLFALLFVVSLANRKLWSEIVQIISHRGITHFLLVPLVLFGLSFFFKGYLSFFLLGLALGWFTHQLGDMTTYGGIINWLFPFYIGRRFWSVPQILRYKTGDISEQVILFFLIVANAYYFLNLFFVGDELFADFVKKWVMAHIS
jgi:hypothetical protein